MAEQEEFLKRLLHAEHDLRAFIGSLVSDAHARDDVYQDAVLTLWRENKSYDPARSFGAWARGVAARKILQHKAQDRRFPAAFSPDGIQAVLEAYERTEESAPLRTSALRDCVGQLPEKSREIVALRYDDELPADQIARKTGQTVDAIYQTLARIRARLEDCVRRRLALESAAVHEVERKGR